MPLPLLLIPFVILPAAVASMHASEVDAARRGCRNCGPRCRCSSGFLSVSTTIVSAGQPTRVPSSRSAPYTLSSPEQAALHYTARIPERSQLLEARSEELDLKVQTLEQAGLPVPDVAASRLSDEEVEKYLDAAWLKGLIDQAIPVLLVMGVPPEAIFLTKYALRYRYWLTPTIFDFLPERWQRAVDGAVGSDWQTDRELASAFLVKLGFDKGTALKILDTVGHGYAAPKDAGAPILTPEEIDAFGMDVSGRRPASWNRNGVRASLIEEEREGHIFASASPR